MAQDLKRSHSDLRVARLACHFFVPKIFSFPIIKTISFPAIIYIHDNLIQLLSIPLDNYSLRPAYSLPNQKGVIPDTISNLSYTYRRELPKSHLIKYVKDV